MHVSCDDYGGRETLTLAGALCAAQQGFRVWAWYKVMVDIDSFVRSDLTSKVRKTASSFDGQMHCMSG